MKEVVRKGMETAAKRGLKQRAVACPLAPVVATRMKSNMGMRTGAGLGAVIASQKIKRAYITGALIGAGVTALGYYLYKKNQQKVIFIYNLFAFNCFNFLFSFHHQGHRIFRV